MQYEPKLSKKGWLPHCPSPLNCSSLSMEFHHLEATIKSLRERFRFVAFLPVNSHIHQIAFAFMKLMYFSGLTVIKNQFLPMFIYPSNRLIVSFLMVAIWESVMACTASPFPRYLIQWIVISPAVLTLQLSSTFPFFFHKIWKFSNANSSLG